MTRLPPSKAARRVACPGSRELEEKYPAVELDTAQEGKTAHALASRRLAAILQLDYPHINVETTQEMIDGADLYMHDIFSTLPQLEKILSYGLEKPLDISNMHPECRGTPDFWALLPRHLYIWDYKYGHKTVEVFENWQLIEYAAGIIYNLGINGQYDEHMQVTFRIIQPRGHHREGPIREWTLAASELRSYFNTLEHAEHAAMEPNALCNPSPECNYCSARSACRALQQSVLTKIETPFINSPNELNPEQTGNLLRQIQYAKKLMEALEIGLKEQAEIMLRKGERVPHFKLVQSGSREQWIKPINEIIALADLYQKDLRKPAEIVTPKQARDMGLSEVLMKGWYERPAGKMVLAETKDNEARKIFGRK